MKQFYTYKVSLILADVLIFIICLSGIYLIFIKADLPFSTAYSNSKIIISENPQEYPDIKAGDTLITIDNFHLSKWEEIELYLDGRRPDEKVKIQLSSDGEIKTKIVLLSKYYNAFDLIIISLVGLIFIIIGVFVRIKARENKSALLFHWASAGLGMVIVLTAGYYNGHQFSYGHINRIVWLFVYSLTPVVFIHFTSSFTKKKIKSIIYILWIFYITAVLNALFLSYLFIGATVNANLYNIKNYVFFFDSFFRLFLITCIIMAISICIYNYRRSTDLEERKRMQWLLLGFFIGPFSFVILWVIPIFLTGYSLIPESLVLIFLTAIPITFSIAIIKYHLMDINLIIRRSVLYTIVLSIIIITYVGISSLLTLFIRDTNPAVPTVITALAVVFLLQPLKSRVQKIIDKKFFRMEYDYREEQNKFLEEIKNIYDVNSLAELIVKRVDNLIPVEKIGFFELSSQTGRVKIIANKGWDLLQGRSIRFESENLKTDLSIPIAVDDKVEPGLKIESADIKVFKRWGMVLVFPIKSPGGIIHGFLVLGVKKSGQRFLKDDIDLLNTVTAATALAIDRIKLQEELVKEQLKAQRLEEIKNLQSFFVSAITHELRTPLQAIKSFAELLQSKRSLIQEKLLEYSQIIEGESDKLSRLIDNILDYKKIETGKELYEKNCIEVNSIIRQTVKSMQYQFNISKKHLKEKILTEEVFINGDPKAVELAVLNLLSNALKYSRESAVTELNTSIKENYYCITIKDEGKGIDKEHLSKIFEAFYRVKGETVRGTGIGLALVKHIMDAHDGKIEVISEPRKGSTFTLLFPLTKDDANSNN